LHLAGGHEADEYILREREGGRERAREHEIKKDKDRNLI
jgi:hypothetical protein